MTARFLSETAQQALAYGVLVSIVREGGTGLDAAFIAVAGALPAATLGLLGGAIADSLPRRGALMTGYLLQALACLLVPMFFGPELVPLLVLVLAVNTFGQLSGPSEQSVVPLIVNEGQVATANSFKDLASSSGQAAGQALLAPVLIKTFGLEPVLYIAALLLLLAALRVASIKGLACKSPVQRVGFAGLTAVIPWVRGQPKVASMLALTILGSLTGLMVLSLGPVYVKSLGADPADTAYVFAPAGLGMIASIAFVPWAARTIGERRAAAIGFVTALAAVLGLGLLSALSRMPGSPSPEVRLAMSAALALPIGFGLTSVSAAVLTYVNRKVPNSHQGRVFALQSTLRNGASLAPMLAMGLLASTAGVQVVLIAAPLLLLAAALLLAGESFRWIFASLDEDLLGEPVMNDDPA